MYLNASSDDLKVMNHKCARLWRWEGWGMTVWVDGLRARGTGAGYPGSRSAHGQGVGDGAARMVPGGCGWVADHEQLIYGAAIGEWGVEDKVYSLRRSMRRMRWTCVFANSLHMGGTGQAGDRLLCWMGW